MALSSSLKTLNITFSISSGCSLIQDVTVSTAISAALLLGKRNTPVEIQQKATLFQTILLAHVQCVPITVCQILLKRRCQFILNDRINQM